MSLAQQRGARGGEKDQGGGAGRSHLARVQAKAPAQRLGEA